MPSGGVHTLQKLTRARRELVQEQTATKNLIRVYVDHIFREFQGKSMWINGKRDHVQPLSDSWGRYSRYFMRYCLHPSDIFSLGEKGLRDLSVRENLKLRDQTIQCLLDYVKHSISKSKELLEADQFLLVHRLDRLDLLDTQIQLFERD